MTANAKKKIEAIFPLTAMQNAFLFHHLQETEDYGCLQVELFIEGELNLDFFKEAWENTIQRHPALRTSIHWENIKQPVQVVHKETILPFTFEDWRIFDEATIQYKLNELRTSKSIELVKAPVSNFLLIQKTNSKYILLWNCHHILLDGWSASNIIKDIFTFYDGLIKNETPKLITLPAQKVYLNWLKKQDEVQAKAFWNNTINNEKESTLFEVNEKPASLLEYKDRIFNLSKKEIFQINRLIKKHQLTINTLIKGCWSLLLAHYFKTRTVSFGTTVSGRSAQIPNISQMAGLFMNVLPIQVDIPFEDSMISWLKSFQAEQAKSINFEHNTLNQIQTWTNNYNQALFDNLVVFENFPWKPIRSGQLEVTDFKGGLTTTYPLNLIIKPSANNYHFVLRYNTEVLSASLVIWFEKELKKLLTNLSITSELNVKNVFDKISISPKIEFPKNVITKKTDTFLYEAPKNTIELKLTKIWEQVLGISPIGVTENFFEIGGKSLHAVRLLTQIKEDFGINLPPITLIQNPTIRGLSKKMIGQEKLPEWSCIVPLKATGTKPPLFCIHGGGGHIFFYNTLATVMDLAQPVYSIQPLGLENIEEVHQSIEEMASYYIKDIKKVQPRGPYVLLGYCFSSTVCIEIRKQLVERGEEAPLIISVDSGPYSSREKNKKVLTISERIARISKMNKYEIKQAFEKRLKKYFGKRGNNELDELLIDEKVKGFRQLKVINNNSSVEIQGHLRNLYKKYKGSPFDSKVLLITSRESTQIGRTKIHVKRWSEATTDLDIVIVEGHHLTLFFKPEVVDLAEIIQKSIDDLLCHHY